MESPYLEGRIAKLQGQVAAVTHAAAEKLVKNGTKAFDQWCEEAGAFLKSSPSGWLTPVAARRGDTVGRPHAADTLEAGRA